MLGYRPRQQSEFHSMVAGLSRRPPALSIGRCNPHHLGHVSGWLRMAVF